MNDSNEHILHMLQNGTISAEEAERLLNAVEAAPDLPDAPPVDERLPDEPLPRGPLPGGRLPHISDYRTGWRAPFLGAAFMAALSATKLLQLQEKRGPFSALRRSFHRLLIVAGTVGALVALWSRDARWLHVKVEQADGKRIEISLPVPVQMVSWLLRTARPYVDAPTANQFDTAIEVIAAMQDEMDRPDGQPIIVDVKDEDSHVQVYFV
ncbi:MAG: hypothetical protein JXN59_16395 [Anaerolineae bacterium]|nr:hypothetical protein [Anaerolineae bacterium]